MDCLINFNGYNKICIIYGLNKINTTTLVYWYFKYNHVQITKWLSTLKELWTSVSSRSMTKHFLCISWCLIAGSKYAECERSGLNGGVKLLSILVLTPWVVVDVSQFLELDLLLDFPKQQNNVCQMLRLLFIRTWLPTKMN